MKLINGAKTVDNVEYGQTQHPPFTMTVFATMDEICSRPHWPGLAHIIPGCAGSREGGRGGWWPKTVRTSTLLGA